MKHQGCKDDKAMYLQDYNLGGHTKHINKTQAHAEELPDLGRTWKGEREVFRSVQKASLLGLKSRKELGQPRARAGVGDRVREPG